VGGRNGLITNDKLCLSRYGKLELNWSRYDVYLKRKASTVLSCCRDEITAQESNRETPVANSTSRHPTSGRTTTLGSSVPTSTAMGNSHPLQYATTASIDSGEES
jgi:hypothetical protein